MYGQGFGGAPRGPVGRGRGAAVPAWMADPALAAQAQAPGGVLAPDPRDVVQPPPPPTGFSAPPFETDEEMAR